MLEIMQLLELDLALLLVEIINSFVPAGREKIRPVGILILINFYSKN